MKKTLSLILSIVMLFSIATTGNMSAFADTYYEEEPNNTFAKKDPIPINSEIYGVCGSYDIDQFYINVSEKKRIKINFTKNYSSQGGWKITWVKFKIGTNTVYNPYYECTIYADEQYSEYTIFDEYLENIGLCISIEPIDYYGYPDDVEYKISVQESIQAPAGFKVSTRNTTSLKLSWSKVANVSGYQLQRKSGGSYKTVTNTTSTTATISNLSTATNYAFRVRAYKTVNGKKYYSDWKYLTTPTKPSKVSIKAPSTNSKHQITAKWNKVTRASGYQVQYCKNKACSNVVATKTISGGSKTSYTGKNFTKGKTYYVRVRAYRTVNGTKYYGAWSNVKSIKCK